MRCWEGCSGTNIKKQRHPEQHVEQVLKAEGVRNWSGHEVLGRMQRNENKKQRHPEQHAEQGLKAEGVRNWSGHEVLGRMSRN